MATYTPVQKNWRWVANDSSTAPTPLANENAQPTLANNDDIIHLRFTFAELGAKADTSVAVAMQYSTNSDMSSPTAFGAAPAHWNYANGVGTEGSAVSGTSQLSDDTSFGEYCESGTNSLSVGASAAMEVDFALQATASVTGSTTYYFQCVQQGSALALDAGESYPTLITAAASPAPASGTDTASVNDGTTTQLAWFNVSLSESTSASETQPTATVEGGEAAPREVNATDTLSAEDTDTVAVKYPDFDTSRAAIINGLVSAQSEAAGWNAEVIAAMLADLTCCVRTSDTVVTITIPTVAGYEITEPETITATVPSACLTSSSADVVSSPTLSVDVDPEPSHVEAATFEDATTVAVQYALSVADEISAGEAEPALEVQEGQASPAEINVLDSVYEDDGDTVAVQYSLSVSDSLEARDATTDVLDFLTVSKSDSVSASDSGEVSGVSPDLSINNTDSVSVDELVDIAVINFGDFDAIRSNIINGLVSAQNEPLGWNAEVIAIMLANPSCVVRTSDTVVTITIPAVPNYTISADEVITANVPATALSSGVGPVVSSPTFGVSDDGTPYSLDRTSIADGASASLFGSLTLNVKDAISNQDRALTWSEWSETGEFDTSQLSHDTASIADGASVVISNLIVSLTDVLSSLDSTTDILQPLLVNLSDNAESNDADSLNLNPLFVSIEDTIESLEYASSLVGVIEPTPFFTDTFGVGDSIAVQLNELNIEVAELVSAIDALSAQADRMVSASDTLDASDSVAAIKQYLEVEASDSVSASDSISAFKDARTFAITQAAEVSDAVYAIIGGTSWVEVEKTAATWTEIAKPTYGTISDGFIDDDGGDGFESRLRTDGFLASDGTWTPITENLTTWTTIPKGS
jgi:hypothetical protein